MREQKLVVVPGLQRPPKRWVEARIDGHQAAQPMVKALAGLHGVEEFLLGSAEKEFCQVWFDQGGHGNHADSSLGGGQSRTADGASARVETPGGGGSQQ